MAALLSLHCAKVCYLFYEYFLFGAVFLYVIKSIFYSKGQGAAKSTLV